MKNPEDPSTRTSDTTSKAAKGKSQPLWRWFWLTFLVVSLGYAWYSFYVPSNDVVWADDIISARQLATESGKSMLLFFTAEWCVPCRIMKREVFADQDVMTAINAKVVPVMIHADDPGADEVFSQYNVGGTPITILTDSQGNVLDYAVGRIGKTEFLEMLEKSGSVDVLGQGAGDPVGGTLGISRILDLDVDQHRDGRNTGESGRDLGGVQIEVPGVMQIIPTAAFRERCRQEQNVPVRIRRIPTGQLDGTISWQLGHAPGAGN